MRRAYWTSPFLGARCRDGRDPAGAGCGPGRRGGAGLSGLGYRLLRWHGTRPGATVTVLSGDELLVEVRLALKAEGCCAEVEIVRLLGAAPGQRNWEIATIGPNTAALM